MATIDWYGDSFVYGYDGGQGGGRVPVPVPAGVQALLPGHTIRNEGVNSNDTTKALAGTDGVHPAWATQMANTNATVVIIALCFNDANAISTSQYQTNLNTMYTQAVAAGKTVVFETCHQVDPSKGNPANHAGIMRNLASSLGVGCIDLYQWSAVYFTQTPITFYVPDGYHPNQTTYNMISQYCARILDNKIANQPAPVGQNAALYQFTFKDEFSGGYTHSDAQGLDTDNWVPRLYNTSDDTSKNYQVTAGALKVWPATGFVQRDISSDSSLVTGGFGQKYGYIEVSAKLPSSKGVVPKLTLLNHDDNSGTYVPEIDLMVAYPGDINYKRTGYWGDTNSKPIRYQMGVYPQKAPYAALTTQSVTTPYTRLMGGVLRSYNFDGGTPWINTTTGQPDLHDWLYSNQDSTPISNAGVSPWITKTTDAGAPVAKFLVRGNAIDPNLYGQRTQASVFQFQLYKRYKVTLQFKFDPSWDFNMGLNGDGLCWQTKGYPKPGQFSNASNAVNMTGNQLFFSILYPTSAMNATSWPGSFTWDNSTGPNGYVATNFTRQTVTSGVYYTIVIDFFADDRPPQFGGQGFCNVTFNGQPWIAHTGPNCHPDQLQDFRWDYGWYNWGGVPTSDRAIYFKQFHVETITQQSTAITEKFFGQHLSSQILNGYPQIAFGTQRTWDAWMNIITARPGVAWTDLNPSSGVYTWDNLDALVNDTASHPGVDLVYAFGYVPLWVTGSATNAPTDAAWTAFVTAIVARYKNQIKYWDLWNEPNASNFWTGTTAQMVNMARLAAPIIRNAGGIVLSPSPQGTNAHTWLDGFFAAGGAPYIDVVNFHGYLFTNPEAITTLITNVKSVMATRGVTGEIWDTEHSWNTTSDPFGANDTQRAAYVARFLTLEAASGIARSIWYAYDNDTYGTLYNKATSTLMQAGIAHRVVRQWLLGNVIGAPIVSGTLYRVPVTKPDGTTGEIVWCGSATTTATTSYTIGAGFVNQFNLDGTSVVVTPGSIVTVDLTPRFYCGAAVLDYSNGSDLSASSHVYGVRYDANGVQFFFDGSAVSGVVPKTMQAGFDKMLLDAQVGFGGLSGTPDGTTTTGSSNALQIDYVRCWQHIDYALVPNASTGGTAPPPQLVIADRVKETTTDTGTGSLALAGALVGYQRFLDVCNVNDTFYGCIEAVDAFGNPTGAWEIGLYTYSAGNKVARTTVLRSSNNNGLVNFGAGTKYVFLDLAATYAKTLKQLQQTSGGGTTPPPTARPYILDSAGNILDTTTTYGAITFADEFAGSNVNTNVWVQNWHPSAKVNYDTTTYVDGGGVTRSVLRMWAQQDTSLPNFTSGSGSDPQNQFYRNELSSVGAGGFQMLTGFLEFRAKLARGKGLFPALWLFNNGPNQQEIDIMEAYGVNDGYYANAQYQFTDWTYTLWHQGGGIGDFTLNGGEKWKDKLGGGFPSPTPFSGTWHTWGFHWDNTTVKLYFDGVLFSTYNHNGWYNQPMFIIIDGWYGYVGQTAGVPDPVNTPQGSANAMEIDWVRVWSLK
jgi:beta-glucanase (GH16 family)